jgi:hypothetical protein
LAEENLPKHSEYSDIPNSLRHRVFKLLDKNPLLKPKQICELLGETYAKRGEVVTQYKKQWKKEYKSQRGLIRSYPDELHHVFYKGKLPSEVVKAILQIMTLNLPNAYEGWKRSRAKNRYWIFRNKLGRIRFFENGTVELWIRKPASAGKAKGLFTQAFVWTRLIDSIQVCDDFYKTLMRRFHATFDYGKRVGYMRITAFKETHGFEFVSGDKTHPTSAEFMFEYHAEVDSARRLFEQMQSFFEQFSLRQSNVRSKSIERDYSF